MSETETPQATTLADYDPKKITLGFTIGGKTLIVREPCAYQSEAIFKLLADVLEGVKDAVPVIQTVWDAVAVAANSKGDEESTSSLIAALSGADLKPVWGLLSDLLGSKSTDLVGLILACPENALTLGVEVKQTIFGGSILTDSKLDEFREAASQLEDALRVEVVSAFLSVYPLGRLGGNVERLLAKVSSQ